MMKRRDFLRSLAGLALVPVLGKVVQATDLGATMAAKAGLVPVIGSADELAEAGEFAEACQKILEILQPAIKALEGLGEISDETGMACEEWAEAAKAYFEQREAYAMARAWELTPSEWEEFENVLPLLPLETAVLDTMRDLEAEHA